MKPICLLYNFLVIISISTLTWCAQLPTSKKQSLTNQPQVKIQCMSGSMVITIKDAPSHADNYFSGTVYPKDLSKNTSCLAEFHNHHGAIKYKLPLRSCSTMPQENENGEIEFFNTIVVQPHLKLVTEMSTSYHVRCKYKSREAATKQPSPGSPQAYTSELIEESKDRSIYGRSLDNSLASNEIPACHMKIYSEGKLAESVKIGDTLDIVVNIDEQDVYGLQVTDCTVRDGLGIGEQQLIDQDGCPMDSEIMGPFKYSKNRKEAIVSFPAHRFPYSSAVYYQCNVKLCASSESKCQEEVVCDGNRRKRETVEENSDEGLPATIEVYSGLYVNENAEILDDEDGVRKEKSNDDAICVSQKNFAIAIAIAGLVLMLLVVLAALCIMARRNKKSSSSSGSSIYSGPYTNTAFSHTS